MHACPIFLNIITATMYHVHVDLNVTKLPILMVNNTLNFTCVAAGYPDVHLVQWQAGTGAAIMESLFSNETVRQSYSVSLVSTLMVENVGSCWQSQGYSCSIRNIGLLTTEQNLIFDCPPGKQFMSNWETLL